MKSGPKSQTATGATSMEAVKVVIDYSELEEDERILDLKLRSIQSRAMKGAGDEIAKDVYANVVILRKKYNKNKRRNRSTKLNKLKNSLAAMLKLCEEEVHREIVTTEDKKDHNRSQSQFAEDETFFVIPSSGGSKIVDGVSSQLKEDLFLHEDEISLDDLDGISDVEQDQEQQTESFEKGNNNKQKQKQRKQKPKPAPKPLQHKQKRPRKWWHSLTEDDPITMEPLRKLKYPPFEIVVKSHEFDRPNVTHHFDGKVLAHYIVSTGNFSNPNNRQELTREDCMRLDEYLAVNRLPKAKVVDAYDLSKMVRIESSDRGRANLLQMEAAVVMQSLFSFDNPGRSGAGSHDRYHTGFNNNHRSNSSFGTTRLVNRVVEQRGGMTVFDGNQWDAVMESTLDDREEFPEMPVSTNPTQLHLSASNWGTSRINAHRTSRSREAFPALGSTAPSNHPTTSVSTNVPGSAGASAWNAPLANPGGWNRDSSKALAESLATASGDAFKEKKAEQPKPADGATMSMSSRARVNLLSPSSPYENAAEIAILDQFQNSLENNGGNIFLCPFTPSIAELARSLGLNWISQIERKLIEFVRNGPSIGVLTPHFPVMPRKKRAFLTMMCRNYFGLDTVTMDQEHHSWVQVSKIPASGEPEVTLTKALMQWGSSWLNPNYSAKAPKFPMYDERFQCIILYGLQSNRKISNQDMYDALDNLCRRSEFAITWLGQDDVILEFGDRIVARKVYTRLKHMASLQNYVKFNQLQWWPCNPAWAVLQMQAKSRSLLQGQRATKEERRRLKTAQRLDHERELMGTQKWNLKSGWDSDDENDKILLRKPSTEQNIERVTNNKWSILS